MHSQNCACKLAWSTWDSGVDCNHGSVIITTKCAQVDSCLAAPKRSLWRALDLEGTCSAWDQHMKRHGRSANMSATRATVTESAVNMCEGEAGLTSKALLWGGHGDAAQDG